MKVLLVILMVFSLQKTWAQDAAKVGIGAGVEGEKKKLDFATAEPEDITNENFPDLIDSFDYPNADIADVIKAISKLTGKNFILDQNVRGKISIIAPSQITKAEAYKAFLSALAANSLTIIPSGKFLKIAPSRNAQRDSIELYTGKYAPDTDQMITRIVQLKFISADELAKTIRTMTTKDGTMQSYGPTNSIIISDYGSNINRLVKIIQRLDIQGFEEKMEVVHIRHATAKDMSDLINEIVDKEGGRATGGRSRSGRRGSFSSVPVLELRQKVELLQRNFGLLMTKEQTHSLLWETTPALSALKNLFAD